MVIIGIFYLLVDLSCIILYYNNNYLFYLYLNLNDIIFKK